MPRRLFQLYFGLTLYGVSASFLVLSGLGNDPWDVLHQGLSRHTGIGTGVWVDLAGALVMLLWIPLRQRPGLGTISNVIVIGLALQVMLNSFGRAHALPEQLALVLAGTLLNGIAAGMYIGADFGPGPRDGLMTGIAKRGHSIRLVRTGLELTVLASGIALGGTFGVATIFYAVAIGPLIQFFLPYFRRPREPRDARSPHAPAGPPACQTAPSTS